MSSTLCGKLRLGIVQLKKKIQLPFLNKILTLRKTTLNLRTSLKSRKRVSTEKAQMKPIGTAHCNTLHSTFCSPFSSIKLSKAISQLSTSTSSGPDQIIYPLLSHLPQSALNFLLYIFNLSWSTHTFPSAWKQSTIIPILKPGKPSDSPSSYRPISLTSCTSKLFERMVLGRLTYFLELHDILSPV